MDFQPMNFVNYLKYMGVGMLGVFMIIGIIIGATYLIGYATSKLSQPKSDSENN